MKPEARLSAEVRVALRYHGCHVYSTEAPRVRGPSGSTPGIPDLVVLDPRRGRSCFAELKVGRRKLTQAQFDFQQRARASGLECLVWRDVSDALAWLGVGKKSGILPTVCRRPSDWPAEPGS